MQKLLAAEVDIYAIEDVTEEIFFKATAAVVDFFGYSVYSFFLSSLFSSCSALCTCSYTHLYLPSLETVQNYWSDVSVPIQSGEEQHGHALEKTLHCNGHTNSSYVAIDKLYKKHNFMYILTKE